MQPVSAASPETVQTRWQPLTQTGGVAYCTGTTARPRIEFHALRIDLSSDGLRIVVAGGGGGQGETLSTTVSSFVRDNNLVAGINALPFEPMSDREREPRTNVGVVIADGVTVSPPHPEFDALVFYADGSAAVTAQSSLGENITHAVGGFRRILESGEPVSRIQNLNARHPRSAAGIAADGKYLYLLVIDGRRPGSVGSTEAETAVLLCSLGASDGINFDGGGSSALALRFPDGKVRVVNRPVHGGIPGRERAVAGCFGVR
ncbi:MAG: phosphodiester glycosidase family protein [Treponema sp.]|nr:phosphodiester glycosidase family protein [Treponema sp.]